MIILDGKKVAEQITFDLKKRVNNLIEKPSFCIIQVGDIFESNKYIKNKIKKANEIGIKTEWKKFDSIIEENELIKNITNIQKKFDGIIIQLPLPKNMNTQKVLDSIDIDKDIDGLTTKNMDKFYNDQKPFFCPATARAIFVLLNFYKINLNKKIMVIGESNLVGKPTKKLLSKFCKKIESRNKLTGIEGSEFYDIIIVAAGSPNLIKSNNVKRNAIIVDVGINTLDNKKVIGDVDFDDVKDKIKAISPVPGGVGPLTVICLLMNLIEKKEGNI